VPGRPTIALSGKSMKVYIIVQKGLDYFFWDVARLYNISM
jgi:hypothetical protein